MNFKGIALAVAAMASVNAYAANDVYGTVSEIHLRSGDNGDHGIYVRLDVMKDYSTFESCIVDGSTMTWDLDMSSPVMAQQYQMLQRSYSEKLPVVISGFADVCANGNTNSDKIFELSPWSWDAYLNKPQAN
ncbi:hypothetical protein [Thalassomonas sp. RHCl1]|uniref:hypothetical protein n=1 Tax=Thalassomonas sp. RHCl1 TaxID=2995320 RepID=UPI00248BC46C|nr:hypothetical protein [Thalassomonas sp. RHCl1]